MTVVGLISPGDMGSVVGRCLVVRGTRVVWAREGRSIATARRAADMGLESVATVPDLLAAADVVLSVVPPHAALHVAADCENYSGLYVDANAVSPATARQIADLLPRADFVDGGIVGPPPRDPGTTRLYLSGRSSARAAELFADTTLEAISVSSEVGAASAVKMAYAAWTKGSAALLLAIRAMARAENVEQRLLAEWRQSLPDLERRSHRAADSAASKGWRWVGEMEQIADSFAAVGLPDGFHRSAAEIFRRTPRNPPTEGVFDDWLDQLLRR